MGKGDKRSRRGKINSKSYGNLRPRASKLRKKKADAKKTGAKTAKKKTTASK